MLAKLYCGLSQYQKTCFEKETLNPFTGMKKEENLYLSEHSITCCFKKSETKIGENEYL